MKRILSLVILMICMLISVPIYASPMTYEQAVAYQRANSEQIKLNLVERKDKFGEKNIGRLFSMMGKNGHMNMGNGTGDRTGINFLISYGFKNITIEPIVGIWWLADLLGRPDKGYAPKFINIVYKNGEVTKLDLQGWEYNFVTDGWGAWGHQYSGIIKLTKLQLYEISQHGEIAAVSIDTANGGFKNFFYTGDKNKKQKDQLNNGIKHALKILDVTPQSIQKDLLEQSKNAEIERKAKLRAEIEAEIKADAEREALKKQILAEMEAEKAGNK